MAKQLPKAIAEKAFDQAQKANPWALSTIIAVAVALLAAFGVMIAIKKSRKCLSDGVDDDLADGAKE